MQIFIPRLTKGTTQGDVYRLTQEILNSRIMLPFAKKPVINSCDILCITDRYDITEYHGLVTITPDKIAEWFIRKVRGRKLHGKLLVAREYYARSDDKALEGSADDNRRSDIEINKLSTERISVVGLDQFKAEHH